MTSTKVAKRGRAGTRARTGLPPAVWAFLLLPAGIEAGLVFWPALNSFYLSLTSWTGVGPPEPVGLDNYRAAFADPVFTQALRNNVVWALGFGVLSVTGGLALALALHRPRRLVGLYRSAIFLPMVFSLAVTGLFWRVQYQPSGSVNSALGALGLGDLERLWLADPDTALYAVLVAAIWRQVGYIMVLYLAGLAGTDPSLADAGAVDGAGPWQRFRYITWPQLRGVNTVVFAVTVIDAVRTFDIVWAMTSGGPYHSTELLSTYMFQQGFTFLNLGYASALAVIIFALALVFIITYLVRATRQEAVG